MDLNLQDRVIMVAASSKGLGYAIAEACAVEGASVSLGSRNEAAIRSAAERIAANTGARSFAQSFDARDADSIAAWTEATLAHFGRIDGLVINAGGPKAGSFEDLNDRDWQEGFELTLLSALRMFRAVLPTMKEQGSGSVLALTSSSIREPIPTLLLSNVMRAGVANLVKSLANEYGACGIRVNNLVPGRIATDRVQELDAMLAERRSSSTAAVREEFEGEIPLGRYGLPSEFARAATFLLSDAASYISGATLLVDGAKANSLW